MTATEDVWFDEEAGPVVRLYAITGGRSGPPPSDFTMAAIVQRVAGAGPAGELPAEQSAIVQLTEKPISVSEIAARLRLPLGSVRVLLADLRDLGLIAVPRARDAGQGPTLQLLERVLSGLTAL